MEQPSIKVCIRLTPYLRKVFFSWAQPQQSAWKWATNKAARGSQTHVATPEYR